MKNSKICVKCNSDNIVKVDDATLRIKTSALTIARVSHYICCDCGYFEEWIDNKKDLAKIQAKHQG